MGSSKKTTYAPIDSRPAGKSSVPVRLTLVTPPPGVDFGVQYGRGARYEAHSVQRSAGQDLSFDFSLNVAAPEGAPNFLGPYAQGPADGRFGYIDVGTYAGQTDTPWSRRIKVPL